MAARPLPLSIDECELRAEGRSALKTSPPGPITTPADAGLPRSGAPGGRHRPRNGHGRAVRERQHTIGILRALGFRAWMVKRSFLWESAVIAVEGIVLGSLLGVLITWLMYRNSAAFEGLDGGFPLESTSIGVLAAATFAAFLLATIGTARRAAAIRPALAIRVSEDAVPRGRAARSSPSWRRGLMTGPTPAIPFRSRLVSCPAGLRAIGTMEHRAPGVERGSAASDWRLDLNRGSSAQSWHRRGRQ
ncbi:ABC transporter permease [Streptomyces ficellus]|uniref:ABC transporter permease n=1 Tax=Streptomyces ficellus TaxID=1977088 RepID=A0A6I6FPS1_9ACTN|nr:ABC transporter permease [Streptomyces ficellus]